MTDIMLGLLVGLAIGGGLIPQPAWVSDLYARWFGIVKAIKDADEANK
jgi:hypothetical protein